ncbi:MAG: peptidylprolyl isomerase [Cyanobacteria bacterium J06641_5]
MESLRNFSRRLLRTGVMTVLLLALSTGLSGAWWNGKDDGIPEARPRAESTLPQGNAITDPTSLLRYALPISNRPVRDLQQDIEDIAYNLRSRRWGPISKDIKGASRVVGYRAPQLLESIPEGQKPAAESAIASIRDDLDVLKEAADRKDKDAVWTVRRQILGQIDILEEMMVPEYPYEVPEEYADLPQLKGRATVELETTKGMITVVVDGYSAPLTAGNFVDLVERGFYDGLPFIRSEDFYIAQFGDPPGPADGYIDPGTGKYRGIPLEILIRGDYEPTYEATLEEIGRYREQPVLPFSAYGTLALARPSLKNNGGSSQVFFFLFEPNLTPAGLNLLDGRYAVFGYAVNGQNVLREIEPQVDEIISAKVVKGSENLVQPV